MTGQSWLPLAVLGSSLLPGLVIFGLREERVGLRTALNLAGAVLKVVLVAVMIAGAWAGEYHEFRFEVAPGLELLLFSDTLSLLFAALSAVLWLVTTVYAIGYLEGSPHRSRFFGFFSLCVAATMGIALAGNLFTFLVFYELLTLSTYPLVVHRGTDAALRAGRVYLAYTIAGGTALLVGTVWLHVLSGPVLFVQAGSLAHVPPADYGQLRVIFLLLVAGLGVKAALVPLHAWLPRAMVAPAPVSALLHAVAVVKAGAFGIVRVIYDVFGVELAQVLQVMQPVAYVAAATILYGSLQALRQDDLKKRLAYSTVSQLSYIVLGTALLGPAATVGGLVHLVHQGLMKITLFFGAGNLAETLGIHKVSEMDGVGRRMPLTMATFTVAALGMIGLPPLAGFISKWYLGIGAVEAGQAWAVWVLVASTVLNAIYFLPIIHAAWFRAPREQWPAAKGRWEADWRLLSPPLVTAALVVAVGVGAGVPFSPLYWVTLIMQAGWGQSVEIGS
ncbi:MAG TPA: proton-conducting transporter membrane subunit [Pelomicrobium sp.]|nr:proton-conducting transporter membrane subunit [Pelomicrobium sp.]